MRLKLGIWTALAVVVFAALLAAAPAVLKPAHVHWPVWPVALAGAVVTALLGLAKPVADAVTQRWADRAKRDLERQDRARELERAVGGRDKGLPSAGEITDRALLGIHPSIPLPPGADTSLSPDLPLYIPRDLDADLRAWITAHHESGGFLLLVGPAASGKSRCAYELVHDMLADWPMFMPSTSAHITDYFEANPAPGKLVVWLNETQKFLGPKGLTVATVRHILALPWPVTIIGTMWPQRYDTLAGPPDMALGDANEDSREILTMLAERKDLLPRFSNAELDRAASLATRDPRIGEAVSETGSWNLTETLAAAPDLISRWLNAADLYGAAVITAAVIARRCGHPEPLPANVLESVAETVLTPAARGRTTERWFQAALDWARAPVRGPAAPLTPQATIPGVVEGDQVSDVLVQQAVRDKSVPGHIISEPTWMLLIDQSTPEACRQIANVAYEQRQERQAPITERAIRKAAAAGDTDAMFKLGVLLVEHGKDGEAGEWYRKAAATGDARAMTNLGVLVEEQGKDGEAEEWLRKAAATGYTGAMSNLGVLVKEQGKDGEAEEWFRKAAATGREGAMFNLGVLLKEQGKDGEAEEWFRKAAANGYVPAMSNLGILVEEQGKDGEAEEWHRKAAATGHAAAMSNLGVLVEAQGKDGEAEEWYRKAAATGYVPAMSNLAMLLEAQGKDGEAEEWYRKAAATGYVPAMSNLAMLLEAQGKDGEAEEWFRKAAATGGAGAMFNLGVLVKEQGKDGEAEEWYRKAAATGHATAMY